MIKPKLAAAGAMLGNGDHFSSSVMFKDLRLRPEGVKRTRVFKMQANLVTPCVEQFQNRFRRERTAAEEYYARAFSWFNQVSIV